MAEKRQGDEDKNNHLIVDAGLLDSLLGPPAPRPPKPLGPAILFVKPETAPRPPAAPSAVERRESPEALLHRAGEQSYLDGRFQDAAEIFERVAAHDPGSWSAHYNLALCRERLERFAEAGVSFEAACQLEPRHWRARTGLGFCLLRGGKAEQALQAFDGALETAPREYQPLLGRAMSMQALKRYADAHGLYAELMEESGDSEDLLANLMLVSLASGRLREAARYAERLRRLAGKSQAALSAAARCFPSIRA